MKKYNVTVNGVTYEVVVEEVGGAAPVMQTPVQAAAPVTATAPTAPAPAPVAAPAQTAAPAPAAPAPAAAGGEGSIKVTAPMPGTILKLNVKVGDTVAANQLVCILEAMKMENEIFAAEGGTVKSVNVTQGATVNSGDTIITLG